jgi:Ulp1 family protease
MLDVTEMVSINRNIDMVSINRNISIVLINGNIDLVSINRNIDMVSINRNIFMVSINRNIDVVSINRSEMPLVKPTSVPRLYKLKIHKYTQRTNRTTERWKRYFTISILVTSLYYDKIHLLTTKCNIFLHFI